MTTLSADVVEDRRSDALAAPGAGAWDLLVIGGGTAGIVAARTAAGLGAKVLLVEQARTGGDCLWTGCVPSKTLLAVAHTAALARGGQGHGIHTTGVRVDFAEVMNRVRSVIEQIEPEDSAATLREAGVRVAFGTVRLTGAETAEVEQGEVMTPVHFRQALIATGSQPVLPSVPGLPDAPWVNSDSVWGIVDLPGRLLVLGAGSIGCELGQAFSRLGSQVTMLEAGPRILPRESQAVATLLQSALVADGVRVHTSAALTQVRHDTDGWHGVTESDDRVPFDLALVAVGRRPRTTGLGLGAARVTLDRRGYVQVDAHLRTSNPRVYAAGDVTGHPQFTHVAGVHGSLAASNAVLGLRRRVDTATVPRVTFTRPEVAAFGVSPDQADGDKGLRVQTVEHDRVDRALAEGDSAGRTDLVLDRRGRVVGASIVGPRAGESLPEVVLAARHGLRARDLAAATHAYPTYADGVWKGSVAQVQQSLNTPVTQLAVRLLRGARRLRVR